MNRVSRKRGRLFVWLIRLLLPLIIFLGSLEIYVRHFVYDSIYRDNDCIYYKKKEEDARKPHR